MFRDPDADPPALVCQVGSTTLKYHLQAIEDLHSWLLEQGDWVPLGAADEGKPAPESSVEAWGRDPTNPVAGWYGLRKGYGANVPKNPGRGRTHGLTRSACISAKGRWSAGRSE